MLGYNYITMWHDVNLFLIYDEYGNIIDAMNYLLSRSPEQEILDTGNTPFAQNENVIV